MARARGLEPLTLRSEVWCSIQLSYARAGQGNWVGKSGASEGIWTLDHWNHNPALYQLSYARRPEEFILTSVEPEDKPFPWKHPKEWVSFDQLDGESSGFSPSDTETGQS